MEDLPVFGQQEQEAGNDSFRGSQTFGNKNFKTFSLIRQQDDFISKFENDLQKTLDMLHDKPPRTEHVTSPPRNTEEFALRKIENMPEELKKKEGFNDSFRKENASPYSNTTNLKTEESRFSAIKGKLRDMKTRLPTYGDEDSLRESSNGGNAKRRIEELTVENESLRTEMNKMKSEHFKKYEQLKKSNDELLLSYEERFKLSTKKLTEQHENEMSELQEEIAEVREDNKKVRESAKAQKEKLGMTIIELEKEKQEILSKMSQLKFKDFDSHSQATTKGESSIINGADIILEQVIKDKNELEKRYNDLFTSYTMLLQHNKALTDRLEENSNNMVSHRTPKNSERLKSAKQNLTKKKSTERSPRGTEGKGGQQKHIKSSYTESSGQKKRVPKGRVDTADSVHHIPEEKSTRKKTEEQHSPLKRSYKAGKSAEKRHLEGSINKRRRSRGEEQDSVHSLVTVEDKGSVIIRETSGMKSHHFKDNSSIKIDDHSMMLDDLKGSMYGYGASSRENNPLATSMSTEHYMAAKGTYRNLYDSQRNLTESHRTNVDTEYDAKKSAKSSILSQRRNSLTNKENKPVNNASNRVANSAQKRARITERSNEGTPLHKARAPFKESIQSDVNLSISTHKVNPRSMTSSMSTTKREAGKDKEKKSLNTSLKHGQGSKDVGGKVSVGSKSGDGAAKKKIPLYSKVNK